ncbi:MAG TPA: DinB family protein [Thermoanaerobaculia bacterium]|nr:DinB family protein [Thermoanaerobaculia bacterium]
MPETTSLGVNERARNLETLAATPAALKAALRGVPRKLLLFTPAPGKWSILEILCHLRDMEREAYLERYTRILAENEPRLPDLNGDALAIERNYRGQKAGDVLRDWMRLRRESLRLLKKSKPEQWRRAGIHETAGRLTIDDLVVRHAVGNDLAHLAQIDAIKRRAALLERLSAAPAALTAALKGVTDEVLRRRPPTGKWSMIENAAHVRDIERVYQERFSKMAFSERPSFWMIDNDRAAAQLKYGEADAAAVAKEFRRLREDTLLLLRALPHAAWRRSGLHPKRGELTLEQLAEVLAGHDDSHIGKIRELRG